MIDVFLQDGILYFLRVTIATVLLLYASYTDIRTRRVSNKVWMVMVSIGIIINIIQAYYTGYKTVGVSVLISLIVMGGLSYILYRLKIFYGADFKAFIGISFITPIVPNFGELPLYALSEITSTNLLLQSDSISIFLVELSKYFAFEMFAFSVFVNTTIFGSLFFLRNIIHNIMNDNFDIYHPLRSSCARQIRKEDIPDTYGIIVEPTDEDNPAKRGFKFIINGLTGVSTDFYSEYIIWYRNFNDSDREIQNLDEIELDKFINDKSDWFSDNIKKDKKMVERVLEREYVWITPSTPFIVPITFGFITSVLFGNIAYIILLLL